jgi:two-component system response regulator
MILVVEDNMDDSFLLTRQLARANLGNQVRVIGDGQDALDFLLDGVETPQVIFLDLRLPRVSGLDLLRRIRQEDRLHTLPVIVMTGSLNPHDVEACAALGVTAYLPKPVGIATFARLLRPVLSQVPALS